MWSLVGKPFIINAVTLVSVVHSKVIMGSWSTIDLYYFSCINDCFNYIYNKVKELQLSKEMNWNGVIRQNSLKKAVKVTGPCAKNETDDLIKNWNWSQTMKQEKADDEGLGEPR